MTIETISTTCIVKSTALNKILRALSKRLSICTMSRSLRSTSISMTNSECQTTAWRTASRSSLSQRELLSTLAPTIQLDGRSRMEQAVHSSDSVRMVRLLPGSNIQRAFQVPGLRTLPRLSTVRRMRPRRTCLTNSASTPRTKLLKCSSVPTCSSGATRSSALDTILSSTGLTLVI